MTYLGHVLTHLRKDLRLSGAPKTSSTACCSSRCWYWSSSPWRLTQPPTPTIARQISGGLLWVALLFASMTALNQSWSRELRNNVLDAHRLSPAPASAFSSERRWPTSSSSVSFELVLAMVFVLFYNLHPLGDTWLLMLILPLGTWALVQWHLFRRAQSAHAQPRVTAADCALPYLHPRTAGHDSRDNRHPYWRIQSRALDQGPHYV